MSESEIIKVYQEGIQSVISLVQGLSTQISELSQTVSDLDARLKKLEKQSNQTSQNSSLPPSTDGFKKTKSLRQPSNKKPGGQVGHQGSTLNRVVNLVFVVIHHPQICQGCGCRLEDVEPEKTIRRQVFDLSPLNIQVTEHRVLIKVCPNCYYKNEGAFPKHVTQPTQYGPQKSSVLAYLSHYQLIPFNRLKQLTQDIFGVTISQGTLVNMTKRFN